jgi:hypothetical protein
MTLYILRAPPPLLRVVIFPRLLRPPVFDRGVSSDFSGRFFVISSNEGRTAFLVPGVIGRKFFNGIFLISL